jgi:hypothetical protein
MCELVAEPNSLRRQRRDQCIQQVRTARAKGGHVKVSQPDIHQNSARAGANKEVLVRPAQCCYLIEQAQFLQHARSVRPEHQTRAHLSQLVRPFVERGVDACAMEREGRGCAADSTADDTNIECEMTHCLFY